MNNIKMPCVDTYCSNSSNNYYVCIPDVCTLYFSYQTLIAFYNGDGELTICQNYWGNTTGKHLNAIHPDKSKRLPRAEFEKAVDRFLTKIGLKGEQNV